MFWLVVLAMCTFSRGAIAYDPGDIYIYTDIWTDTEETIPDEFSTEEGIYSYGTATGEIEGCPEWYPDLDIENDLREEASGSMNSDGRSGFCFASASTEYFFVPGVSPDGEYYSRGEVPSNCVETQRQTQLLFTAILHYDHHNLLINKHEWHRHIETCNGKCQPDKWCTTGHEPGKDWLTITGVRLVTPVASACKILKYFQVPFPPPCVQRFGIYAGPNNCHAGAPLPTPN
jgi:hypothetical protein